MRLRPPMSEAEGGERYVSKLRELKLTNREAEVLIWVSRGKTNYEIAVVVEASRDTIRTHVSSILRKLSVENRTAAAAIAYEAIQTVCF